MKFVTQSLVMVNFYENYRIVREDSAKKIGDSITDIYFDIYSATERTKVWIESAFREASCL